MILASVRVASLTLASMFCGGGIALLVHAQGRPTPDIIAQEAVQQVKLDIVSVQLGNMQTKIEHLDSEVSTMQGIGVGFGGVFVLLQLLQMVFSKKPGAP